MLFSEPKIPQSARSGARRAARTVSVLFSEPKIPQCNSPGASLASASSFSALQRAENSSIAACGNAALYGQRFSALQRAENSSTRRGAVGAGVDHVSVLFSEPKIPQRLQRTDDVCLYEFQCSSASRKFLNRRRKQRLFDGDDVSVLFSEPKIPQLIVVGYSGLGGGFQCSSASRKFLNPTLAPASIHIPDCDDHASSFLSLPGASP